MQAKEKEKALFSITIVLVEGQSIKDENKDASPFQLNETSLISNHGNACLCWSKGRS